MSDATKAARVQGLTVSQAAKCAGVSVRLMYQSVSIRRNGCNELIDAVLDGRITTRLATMIIKFDHESQAVIVAGLRDIPQKQRAGVVELLLGNMAHGEQPNA